MKGYKFSRQFNKSYAKRIKTNRSLEVKAKLHIKLFILGKKGYPLKDHALTGKLAGMRAFSVTADIRVIYEESIDEVIFLDIGTHNQVY